VIFLSGQLYHSVGEWTPASSKPGEKLTPGRIGNVFFFPKASFEKLKGKKAGWMVNTLSGTALDVDEGGSRRHF